MTNVSDHRSVALDRELTVAALGNETATEELDDRLHATQEFDVGDSGFHAVNSNAPSPDTSRSGTASYASLDA